MKYFLKTAIILNILYSINIYAQNKMIPINAGTYPAFYIEKYTESSKEYQNSSDEIAITKFCLQQYPVTNKEYLKFLIAHPQWQRSKIKKIFADDGYLKGWSSDLNFGNLNSNSPVVNISWFSAKAYCESINAVLPETDQWEYVIHNNGKNAEIIKERILRWYSQPNKKYIGEVGKIYKNEFGIHDLGFLVWEWTNDFNSFLSLSDSRNDGKKTTLFCGNTANLGNTSDYTVFIRYAFRSSLNAQYTTSGLGFRCAKQKCDRN